MHIEVVVGNASHNKYAQIICDTIEESAKVRGTGIAKRTPEYIISKFESGNAVIALENGNFAGFCYIEVWGHEKYVANSGLIVYPDYRNMGLAKRIKQAVFDLSRQKFPEAKIFGITTGLAVMKINYELGYRPVPFSELTDDPVFGKDVKPVKTTTFCNAPNSECVFAQGCFTTQKKKQRKKELKNIRTTTRC